MSEPQTRVLLLRHAKVASHRGDVPVTEDGFAHAEQVGKAIGQQTDTAVSVLFGGTRRTRETAEAIIRGIGNDDRVSGPVDSFGLRNPDLYLAGTRVNMVSSAESLAEQVPGVTAQQAATNEWWSNFLASSDRIGWWLGHDDPPGETAEELNARIVRFIRTFADPGPLQGHLVLCVTHSPVLRAVLLGATGEDLGEPAYVSGAEIIVQRSAQLTIRTWKGI